MKRIIVVMIVLALSLGVYAKDKKKDKEAEGTKLLLDDARLETEELQIKYAEELSGNLTTSIPNLYMSVSSMGTDFNPIVAEFQSASTDVAYANEIILQALDLRKDVLAAGADIKAAESGNAGTVMIEKSKEAEAKLQQMANEKTELNKVQKAWMKAGLIRLGAAVIRETGLIIATKKYTDHVNSLSGMAKMKEGKNLASAGSMATEIPKMLSNQGNTLKSLMAIATANGIEVPKEIKLP